MKGATSQILRTDVLIIGAGGAGIRAAIETQSQGLDTLLLGKEVLGCAHTGMAMGGMNAAMNPPATPQYHFDITLEGGYFINNHKIVRAFTEEIKDRIYDLERYGAMFDRNDDGTFYAWAGPKQIYPLNICVGDYTGREMMQALVDEARKLGVKYSDEFFVTRIVQKNGRICGAIGFDIKSGELIGIEAKSVILAAGGAGRMYEITTNAASNTGDGYAMALDLGVPLIDMEMVQFHPTGMIYPDQYKGVLITEKVRAHDGWLLNKNGERFMKNYYPKEMELAKRDEVSRSIFLEVKKGGGTEHGGVYLDIRHWGLEKTKELIPDVYDQYAVIGVDITKQKMEVYPTMHHMMGGIKINEWCHTPVEGFFACGEVAAGVHGANRLGGNSISEGQVFGRRAGISATKHAQKTTYEELPKQYVEEELEKINTFKSKKTGILPSEIESALKKTMWENVGVFRDQHRLELALMTINVLKKDMMSLKARNQAAERNRDLQDCIEVCNMVNTAEAVVKSALIRKESRGAHSRLDYPETKSEWEKNIQVIKNQNQISTEIIEVVKE